MINPNTNNRTDAKVKGDPMDGILAYGSSVKSSVPDRVYDYPENLVPLLVTFVEIWCPPEGSIPSKKQTGKYNNWVSQLEELNKLFSSTERMKLAMRYSFEKYEKEGHRQVIYQPASIRQILVDGISELRRMEKAKITKEEKVKIASAETIQKAIKNLKKTFNESEDD